AGARPDEITVKLYREGVLLRTQKVTPNASGGWSYTFANLDKYKDGVEVNYSVEEEYVPGYIAYFDESGQLINEYHPYGDLTIGKAIKDATPAAADKAFTFTLLLTNAAGEVDAGDYRYTTSDGRSGAIASGGSLVLKGGQTATVKDLPSEGTYTVTEAESDGYKATQVLGATGTIRAGQEAQAGFTNTYESTGTVQLKAKKELLGRTLTNKQFSFQVFDEEGNAIRSASCKADGSVTFGLIRYDATDDGKTYTYYIQEKVPADAVNAEGITWEEATDTQKSAGGFSKKGYTYDSSRHKVTVAVADNGDGTMKVTPTYEDGDVPCIENAYKASGSVTLNLWKTLAARDLKDGEFTFGLFDEQGNAVLDKDGKAITAKNAADGTVTFPSISYDQTNADQTYTYVAKEIIPNEGDAGYDETVVYDATEWKYRVSVYDNGDGTLSFDQTTISPDGEEGKLPVIANTLKPGNLTISKGIKNGNPGQEFKFLVKLTSPTGESLDGDYDFKREEGIPQTVDFTTVDIEGAALPGVGYTVYKVAPDGSRTVIGNYVSDDDGNVNIQGLDKFEEGYSYIASITNVPNGYIAPSSPDVALTYDSTTGTWSSAVTIDSPNSQAYAYYDSSTQTLTFARAKDIESIPDKPVGTITYYKLDFDTWFTSSTDDVPWNKERSGIKTVVFKNRINPVSMSAWFTNCSNLERIQGMDLLDDSNLEKMGSTFMDCSKLTELDLSSFTGAKLTNMYSTFSGCSNLRTIYASEQFSPVLSQNKESTFKGCTSLVGGAGTAYSSNHVDGNYAHIDGGPSNPGYFTDISDKPAGASALADFDSEDDLSAASLDDEATALAAANSGTCGTCVWEFGDDGVFTIKPADGVEGTLGSMSYYNHDGAIIVPWRSLDKSGITNIKIEGTIHAGQYVEAMFQGFSNVVSMDLAGFDTSAVKSMRAMFNGCGKLASLDLSGFKTSNVTEMRNMFDGCASLTSLDLSSFDTSRVTNMESMFSSCSSLASLKLSGFNTSLVTSMGWMFYGCRSLESLDLSSFSTPLLTSMNHAFNGCASLKSLDVRNFDTSNAAVDGMLLNCSSLSKIVLGDAPFCKGSDGVAALPVPSPTSQFTGKWVCEDNPSLVLDAWALSNSHPSADAPAGTWVWQEKSTTYTVTFDSNGGSGAMAQQSYKIDTDYQLPANSFYLFAKKFVGWNTAANGSGTWYDDGATVRNLAGVDGNATLYAQWEDDSSGTLTNGQMKVTLHGNESLTIPNLPAGTQYQVYEQTPSGWVLVKQSGGAGVIEPLKNAHAVFTNDYQPGKAQATIVGTKTVDEDVGKVNAGDYSFELRDSGGMLLETVPCGAGGSIAFAPITYEAAGTWTYKVKEVVPQDQGNIQYDTHEETVTVEVSDDGAGNLSSSVQYDSSGVAFDNHDATPTTGRLSITKSVEGAVDASKEFTFDVTTIKDGVRTTKQVKVGAGQTLDLGEFPEGTTYSIAETDIPAGYTLKGSSGASGTIVAGETQNATFTNAYSAKGSVALSATKKLAGGTLESGQFSFELRDDAGNVVQTVTNDADGIVAFEPISYTAAGTYHYTIAEVVPGQGEAGFDAAIAYDAHKEDVTVNVTDKGNGTLSAAATYDKDGAAFENSVKPGAIQLTKTVTGATDVVAGKKFPFELVLKDGQGNPLTDSFPYRNSDGATGTVKSGDVIEIAADQMVTVEGIPAGTAYSFVEQVPAGFTQKTSDATEGVVDADATASASVENEYETSGSWTPDATKVLKGSELASGQFNFLLLDSEGNVVQTAKNDADGKVVFQAIQYTGEDHGKTFKYSIVEVNDGQDNLTYDDHIAKVSVTVTDNGDGTMTVTPVYGTGDEGNIFTNLWKLIMPETGDTSFLRFAGLGLLAVLISSLALALRRRRNEERAHVHWR
ncbi:Spy0128 family protein, partial [Ellagibacter isourolithinifaciens]|uniref:Spy0128 family protein n=1 Tax=Ellagibacter isourolithinifaciens TaxID=2137581 RepID=UPI003AAADE6C